MSLSRSVGFFANFIVKYFSKRKLRRKDGIVKGKKRAMWRKLNEQRRNVMTLAGYTPSIVFPSFLFLLLGALMTSIVPSYYSKCIQCVSTLTTSRSHLLEAMFGLGITSALAALFTGLRGSLFWIGGSRANYNVRVKLHRSLLLQEAAFFDMNETGYLLSRLNSDVNKIGQVISYHVNVVFRQLAQFIFGSIYLFKISPKLSMWTFCGISLVAWLSAVYGDLSRLLAEKVQDTFADATAVAETSFSMSETIRAFDGAILESAKFEGAQNKALQMEEVQAWAYGSHKFLSDTLQTILQVALLFACWNVGRAGGLPAGKLTTFMFYTNFVLESSNEVGDQWAKIQQAVGASSSVFDLIKRVPAIRDPKAKEDNSTGSNLDNDLINSSPILSLSDVRVEYEAMERPALDEINVDIFSGDRVALVGRSGSGKSSMLRCLMRFYDPSHGAIKLCGQDLRQITRAETAKQIAAVAQEPHMFPTTLAENILYGVEKDTINAGNGTPEYSRKLLDSVADCLSLAGLPIEPGNELGLTLETRVGEGGRSLSGGQCQRAAIARALIRSPDVLLLDEPTAALDSESEKLVVGSLQKAMQRTKCMVMVTHRLGIIRSLDVNRVLVLDKGKIVEDGHPEDLLRQKNGLYAALAREQGITSRSNETFTPV
eukprot:CAMPEP_0113624124 /NCGR_PEP_ID=MMETSP0017_2-20120614/12431_1 /TAXON_ID=2856 /ORGANISM="Cylindrotheca closterium" /LENGTH=655 /DNA_ID=CAMNT_0000534135 /DNA_START=305 /DNA_END=2272 /DNA_ORIENTATION=+ /assembly_acc=CAM_ASM_000147